MGLLDYFKKMVHRAPTKTFVSPAVVNALALTQVDGERALPYLQEAAERFAINTPQRVAHWLAQVAHESAGFALTTENMNYSASGLVATFGPKVHSAGVTAEEAEMLKRKPTEIAERVYGIDRSPKIARRLGNLGLGDGAKFIGHGFIQVTGRLKHAEIAAYFGKQYGFETAEDAIIWLCTTQGAALSAGLIWHSKDLNALADGNLVESITRAINGGLNGINDRRARYVKACDALGIIA